MGIKNATSLGRPVAKRNIIKRMQSYLYAPQPSSSRTIRAQRADENATPTHHHDIPPASRPAPRPNHQDRQTGQCTKVVRGSNPMRMAMFRSHLNMYSSATMKPAETAVRTATVNVNAPILPVPLWSRTSAGEYRHTIYEYIYCAFRFPCSSCP